MQWILLGMVAAGALILMVSMHNSRNLSRIVPVAFKSKWRILSLLIGLFIVGYCGYLLFQLAEIAFPLHLLISTIFLGGALFVYGIISHPLLAVGLFISGVVLGAAGGVVVSIGLLAELVLHHFIRINPAVYTAENDES